MSRNGNPAVGDPVDLVPFGRMSVWTGDDRLTIERSDPPYENGAWTPAPAQEPDRHQLGVEWTEPRRFERIVVRFADEVPSPDEVKFQYWHHTWPEQWAGGWTAVDDPFNGKWLSALGELQTEGDTWTFSFDPLDVVELWQAEDFAVTFRQALKVRLLFKGVAPRIADLRVIGTSVWREADLRIEFGLSPDGLKYGGSIRVHDGYVLSVDDSDPKSVRAKILYADADSTERTVITVAGDERDFSFCVRDALADGVRIPDLGIRVGNALRGVPGQLNSAQPEDSGTPRRAFPTIYDRGTPRRAFPTIYDRVLEEPEQSYERASREIPQLIKTKQDIFGRYVPIGCDANRQEFALRYNAEIFADKYELKLVGRDAARLLWPGRSIYFKFPTGDPPDFRYREDGTEQSAMNGYLPIYTSTWKDREFAFEMTSFAALLDESPWEEEKKRGDEPIVALSRVKIRNTTEEKRTARFWIVVENPEELCADDGFIYATGRARDDSVPDAAVQKRWTVQKYPTRRLRAYIDIKGRGEAKAVPCAYEPLGITSIPNAVAYDIELEPRTSHEIDLFIPFITFTAEALPAPFPAALAASADEGRTEIRALSYDAKLAEMSDYWQKQIDAGARIEVPEELLTDFNRANLAHIAITADKDIDTGLYILGAGTWRYQVYGTETVDQTRSLDLRGYHDRARKYIMPFVELQGTRRMDGRFKSQEGALHGVRVNEDHDYQVGDYSLDHGTVLWMLGEHYRLTRDREWLGSIAPNIIAACDYVTRERQATMRMDDDGSKAREYGLLPPAHLDDNPEWLYWYINNTLAYRGMALAGEVLAEIGHQDAPRIALDAQAYGEDIRRALHRSIEESPVMRLADGDYVPHTPVRALLRGKDVGWIREALYGPMFNIECGLIEPNAIETTWALKDYEDNIFVSRTTGRQVDLERFWFSQGGLTIQSNLLPTTLVYLMRDQVEHALRAFYNSFAANLYADVRCFTEHPVGAYGLGAGPFYKTPDESAFLTWFRYLLLEERGNSLLIAPGTPRKWLEHGKEIKVEDAPTHFGPMSYRIISEVADGQILAEITPPKRNPPAQLVLRLRHPSKSPIKSVTVNGSPHAEFDPAKETITFPGAAPGKVEIVATY